jgi:hypothetical protein
VTLTQGGWPASIFGLALVEWSATGDQDASRNLLVDLSSGVTKSDARDTTHAARAVRQAPGIFAPVPNCGGWPWGDTKCVFVTSKVSTANLGGLASADAICNAHANSVGLPGTYVAWLSDDNTDAVSRVTSNGPYANTDGQIVANSLADLTDGSLSLPIDKDEWGNTLPVREVWTGTDAFGGGTTWNCDNWTTGNVNAEYGTVGWNTATEATDPGWSLQYLWQFCDRNVSLYCIQQ